MFSFFEVFVTYRQIAVIDPDLQNPFNDWTPQHVAQGFSWRPGSVSFATLDDSGPIKVQVQRVNDFVPRVDSKRAILVPFNVGPSGRVKVAPLDRGKLLSIPCGTYALVFETGHDSDGVMWSRFSFVPSDTVKARIIRADSGLSPSCPLVMQAFAA